jgi:hypothetical protein
MRKIIISGIIASVFGLLAPQIIQAQGTMFVSNVGQTPVGSAAIGSDAWIAQSFRTGTNAGGYALNSIQLLMNAGTASPGGFSVSVYNITGDPHTIGSSDSPQNSLGNFAGPDPAAGGLFTYSASSLELLPSTVYFVVATAASPVAQGAYNWGSVVETVGQNGTPGRADGHGHEKLLCQNAASAGQEDEFSALARGLRRHPGQWASADHMFERVSTHFRP